MGRFGSFAEEHGLMVLVLLELAVLVLLGRRGVGGRASGGE
jgi:hypothetical protein